MFKLGLVILLPFLMGSPSFASDPAQVPVIDRALFQPGQKWIWIYSSLDKKSGLWQSYFRETYTVTAREGERVTIEMSSHSLPKDVDTPAHHKFVIDLRNCPLATSDAKYRSWGVEFYTKSYGPDWQLVSRYHPNLVFTEKFNCYQPKSIQKLAHSTAVWKGESQETLQIGLLGVADPSFYFTTSDVAGVAATKVFAPTWDYKFELSEVVPPPHLLRQ